MKYRRARKLLSWIHVLFLPRQYLIPFEHFAPCAERGKVRKFGHDEAKVLRCLLPLHTRELGRLSVPEEEREADTIEDGAVGDTRTEEEAVAEYTIFMDEKGIPAEVCANVTNDMRQKETSCFLKNDMA